MMWSCRNAETFADSERYPGGISLVKPDQFAEGTAPLQVADIFHRESLRQSLQKGEAMLRRSWVVAALMVFDLTRARSQTTSPVDQAITRQVDSIANGIVASTGVPSASVAVVR